jgi:hypothetical protein
MQLVVVLQTPTHMRQPKMGDKISFSAPQPQLEALLTKLRDAVGSAGSVQSIKLQGREYGIQYIDVRK